MRSQRVYSPRVQRVGGCHRCRLASLITRQNADPRSNRMWLRAVPIAGLEPSPVMPKDMSDRRLTTIHLKDLQNLMDEAPYDEVQQEEIRARRRKLQNRLSAKTSAARKRKQFASMTESSMLVERELQGLRCQVTDLQSENMTLRVQTETARQHEASAVHETELFRRVITMLTSQLAATKQPDTAYAYAPHEPQGEHDREQEAESGEPANMVMVPVAEADHGSCHATPLPTINAHSSVYYAPAW